MSLLELAPGVFLASHHVDALEISCAVDQVPHLVGKEASLPTHKGQGTETVRRDYKTAATVCELEAKLDQLKRHGEKLNLEGERATGWLWREGDTDQQVRLLPTAKRAGHAFALETDDWLLMIERFKSVRPRFAFQVRADYLLETGAAEAYRRVVEWWTENIRPLLVGMMEESPPVWRISRIDLASDLAGAKLLATDLNCLTTRARQRKEHHTTQDTTGRHVGRRFTGFEIGKRGAAFYARIYDKTIQAAPDALVRKVWETNGYKAQAHGETVWRVEFELRSQLLREMLREDGTRLSDDPARTLDEDLDGLWREAVSKRLLLKERTGNARVERRPVRDWWEQMKKLDEHLPLTGQTGTRLKRQAPVSNDTERFLTTALQSLATVGLLTEDPKLADCLKQLTDHYFESGGDKAFAEMIARAEARRDPSMPISKQAIAIRANEIVASGGFAGTTAETELKTCRARLSFRAKRQVSARQISSRPFARKLALSRG